MALTPLWSFFFLHSFLGDSFSTKMALKCIHWDIKRKIIGVASFAGLLNYCGCRSSNSMVLSFTPAIYKIILPRLRCGGIIDSYQCFVYTFTAVRTTATLSERTSKRFEDRCFERCSGWYVFFCLRGSECELIWLLLYSVTKRRYKGCKNI